MNDEEIEARLARWQPADVPSDLMRRLRAAEPPGRTARWSWPLAYASLSTAWSIIFVLWLFTPPARPVPNVPQTNAASADLFTPTSALAMERSFLLRANPDELRP